MGFILIFFMCILVGAWACRCATIPAQGVVVGGWALSLSIFLMLAAALKIAKRFSAQHDIARL